MNSNRTQLWYLIGTLSVGGAEQTLVDLANGLDTNQFDVTIWTILEPGPLAADVDDHVTVRSLEATGKLDVSAPLRFVAVLRRERPNILQSFLFYDNTLAALASVFSRDTTVISGVRAVPNDPSRIRTLVRYVTPRLVDHVVSNSKAGSEFITDHGADPGKLTVIHNGRNLRKYAQGTATAKLYQELGVDNQGPVIGTVGRLLERKGHYELVEAWPWVRANHPDAQLVIVGDGPEADGLQKRAAELGCAGSIKFTGHRDDIPAVLDLFDVFVFPSHFEGLPGALLEAMAAGKPIATTPVDGNSELVRDGKHGIHVPPENQKRLAAAIDQLLADPELADTLGKNASERAQAAFSLINMLSDFEELYENITTA